MKCFKDMNQGSWMLSYGAHVKYHVVVIKNKNIHYFHHIVIKRLFELLYINVHKQNTILYISAANEDELKHLIFVVK